jgi:hypothetical protein
MFVISSLHCSVSLTFLVRVNVIPALLVGSGFYIQLCVAISTPRCADYVVNIHTREYPNILVIYSIICTLCHYIGKWSLSDSRGLACSLTVLGFLAKSTFENWPNWRGGGDQSIIVIYSTGVLIMLGVKRYELSHLVQGCRAVGYRYGLIGKIQITRRACGLTKIES